MLTNLHPSAKGLSGCELEKMDENGYMSSTQKVIKPRGEKEKPNAFETKR